MGCVENIRTDYFPRQGEQLGRMVAVVFHYDTKHPTAGKVVRDDAEPPYQTIIKLANGRYVLSGECQYSFMD